MSTPAPSGVAAPPAPGFGAGATNPQQQPPGMPPAGQPPAPPADQGGTPEIPPKLKELGLTPEQYQKLSTAGVLIAEPPKTIDELPDGPVKTLLLEQRREFERQGAQLARDQLHTTLEKNRQDIEALRKLVEDREAQIKAAVAAEEARVKEEEEKNLTQAQKIEALRSETRQAIEQISSSAQKMEQQLRNELQVAQLSALREKLLAQAGNQIIPELVPDPTRVPGLTPEQLEEGFNAAKLKWQEMRAALIEEAKKELVAQGMAVPQPAPSPAGPIPSQTGNYGVVPPGSGHIGGAPSTFDSKAVKQMGREQLEEQKRKWLKHFGFEG